MDPGHHCQRHHSRGWRGAVAVLRLLALTLASGLVAAESGPRPLEQDFVVRSWGRESGLPDDRVLALLVDRNGLLWIGTRKGVSRFDGAQFTTWSRATHEVFTSEECLALAQGDDGILWVGTVDGLIQLGTPPARHEPRNYRPRRFQYTASLANTVRCLETTAAGELLAGTGTGLLVWSPDGTDDRPDLAEQSRLGPCNCLARSPEGVVWAGTTSQLFRRAHPHAPWTAALPGGESPETNSVHGLALAPGGVLHALVGSWVRNTGRMYRYTGTDWLPLLDRDLNNFSQPLFLRATATGALWFPTTGRQIGCWRENRLVEYTLPSRLAGDVLRCVADDGEGNLWAGTARNGLLCLQPRHVRPLVATNALPDLTVRTLLEHSDGGIWVGTDAGLARFAGDERRQFTQASGLASDRIRALAEDSRGRLWIGTGAGLDRWDGDQLQRVNYAGLPHRTKIRTLCAGRDDTLWLGTAQGLHRFGPAGTNEWTVADGLPHENVCALLEDGLGRLWIGMDGGGLARFTDPGFERFDAARGLSSLRVWALHADESGALWIGTDRGLNVLRNGHVTALTTAHGLPDNLVNSIVADRRGWLWIGHDRGVYRANRAELLEVADGSRPRIQCLAYAEADGLWDPETNGQISSPAAIGLRDGRIAFATMGGVAVFDPDSPPDSPRGPPASILELRAGGVVHLASPPGTGSPAIRVASGSKVCIDPEHRSHVEVQYTAATFRNPAQTRFRHRLLGLSPDWVEAGTLRQASYLNLRPGDYTFEVSAQNPHGQPSPVAARLGFHIEPRWHERLPVRLAGAAGLVVTTAGLVRWRVRERRRLQELTQQAALASQRSRLAKDLHDGLGANLTELSLLSGLGEPARLPPEVLARRFEQLSRSTHEALHALRDLIWTTNPKADSLPFLVARLCGTAERTLEAAGLGCRLDFPAELPDVALGPDFRRDLLFAVSEALNNAIRHARAREVALRVHLDGARLVIELQDDGRGFELTEVAQRPAAPDRGLGLAALRERLVPHGGACEIRTAPGRGTQVTFVVPLPR